MNPTIIKLASDPYGYFSYLRDSSAKVGIVPGDARLSMERELAEGRSQQFDVLDVSGRIVSRTPAAEWTAGRWSMAWKARGPDGAPLPSGMYFARMQAGARIVALRKFAIVH